MKYFPKEMKAAILVEQKSPLVVDTVCLPENLECGQVLVKVQYSGICGSQLGEINGVKGPDNYLPHLLGHEGSGIVLETGPGVGHVHNGDKVVLHWMKGDGIEAAPPNYSWRGKKLNAGCVTTFNEYAIVSENRLTAIPEEIDGRIAALFGCAVTTGLGVITNNAELRIGESIVVFGAGGVGLNVIQGAKLSSAYPIIAIDIHDNKLDLALKVGATHVINSLEMDMETEISAMLGGRGADVVVDNTGLPEIIQSAYRIASSKGRVVLVGVPKKEANVSIFTLPLHFGKALIGSHGGETKPSEDIPRYLKLLESGILKLDAFVTHEFALKEINKAVFMMRSGEIAGRCVVNLGQ